MLPTDAWIVITGLVIVAWAAITLAASCWMRNGHVLFVILGSAVLVAACLLILAAALTALG